MGFPAMSEQRNAHFSTALSSEERKIHFYAETPRETFI